MSNLLIIQDKLKAYKLNTAGEEQNALKEILQEIILYGLSTTDFFTRATFNGGTALRILHRLPRFSEDLDFALKVPEQHFNCKKYVDAITLICEEYGAASTIIDKSKLSAPIQKLFIKNDSIGKLIELTFKKTIKTNITIKLEIDINPPAEATFETQYLNFPLYYAVEAQDLPSSFAGKSHALLCRKYIKGRDWYDFLWYVSKRISPNLSLLQNALHQMSPWQNQDITVTPKWYIAQLKNKINSINWDTAKADVERFLYERERQQLSLWGQAFFTDQAEALAKIMVNGTDGFL